MPENPQTFVLAASSKMPENSIQIRGFEFKENWKYSELMASYRSTGYQASNLHRAIEIINEMLAWRLFDEEILEDETEEFKNMETRKNYKCKIFLGYTSNLVSCGLREIIKFIVETKQVDCIVSSAGGVEEDFIKCLGDTFLGAFDLDGVGLRKQGLNRIGNLIVPNEKYLLLDNHSYCQFETWVFPILDQLLLEQQRDGIVWTPSKIISRLGKEINHPDSIYYWAYKNNIPVFCPALTDGSLGDMIYFHGLKNPGLIVDIAGDIREMNNQAGKNFDF
jgi:deoxyhypusine synthase